MRKSANSVCCFIAKDPNLLPIVAVVLRDPPPVVYVAVPLEIPLK